MDAAQEAFAARGFAGASIRDLAAAAGIKESSLYNHFTGKQALLDAVMDRAQERLAAVAESFHVPFDDPSLATEAYATIDADRLEVMAAAYLRTWLTDPGVVAARRVLTLEQYRTPQAGCRLRRLTVEAPLAFQAELFGALMDRGLFRPAPPQAVALAFWGPILAIASGAEGRCDGGEGRDGGPADGGRGDARDGGPADDGADDRDGEEGDDGNSRAGALEHALELLHLHLEHFAQTHLTGAAGTGGRP